MKMLPRPRNHSIWLAALFVTLQLVANAYCLDAAYPEDVAVAKLMDHVAQFGAEMNIELVRDPKTNLRGVVASKDIPDNGTVLAIPFEVALFMDKLESNSYNAELATRWIAKMHKDPTFNETYGLYMDTLPTEHELFSEDLFTEKHISMLQHPALEERIRYTQRGVEQIYNGTYHWSKTPSLLEATGKEIPLHVFKRFAALITTRDFWVEDEDVEDAATDGTKVLVPVADLINHSDDANVWRWDNLTHLIMYAGENITKGQELSFNYLIGVQHRNDLNLMSYGFVQDKDPPLMLAMDLPTYTADNLFDGSPLTDHSFYGPIGKYNTWEEYYRLRKMLKECATTDEEDEELLRLGQGKGYEDWKEEMVIKFRLYRKRALMVNMGRIRKELMRREEL